MRNVGVFLVATDVVLDAENDIKVEYDANRPTTYISRLIYSKYGLLSRNRLTITESSNGMIGYKIVTPIE